MAARQHLIRLTAQERPQVERAVRSNKNSPRERMRARILLAASDEPAWSDQQIAGRVGACLNTLARARNTAAARIDWRFTTEDARIKLKHLYPAILP